MRAGRSESIKADIVVTSRIHGGELDGGADTSERTSRRFNFSALNHQRARALSSACSQHVATTSSKPQTKTGRPTACRLQTIMQSSRSCSLPPVEVSHISLLTSNEAFKFLFVCKHGTHWGCAQNAVCFTCSPMMSFRMHTVTHGGHFTPLHRSEQLRSLPAVATLTSRRIYRDRLYN